MIKPLPGWVLIEPEKEENKTASGIMLPDSSQDVPMRGKILAKSNVLVASGELIPLIDPKPESFGYSALAEDSIVLFRKYSGQTVKHEGKELKLVEFKDLLAVIE